MYPSLYIFLRGIILQWKANIFMKVCFATRDFWDNPRRTVITIQNQTDMSAFMILSANDCTTANNQPILGNISRKKNWRCLLNGWKQINMSTFYHGIPVFRYRLFCIALAFNLMISFIKALPCISSGQGYLNKTWNVHKLYKQVLKCLFTQPETNSRSKIV